ncbi:MAG TPA: AMP-binding protein [Spirochaetota bacterium]|nr:AMP-binding protein [Spirochaetota bacterium]
MSLLSKFMDKWEFSSYEDFSENFDIKVPENFNFAYDVVDYYAEHEPDRRALVWCNEDGEEHIFTFRDMKVMSDKTANVFRKMGIGKGDPVMLILKQRYEFWFCILALHKIGAVTIPATHMLTVHDIEYRVNLADIKMIVAVTSDQLNDYIDEAQTKTKTLTHKMTVNGKRDGWSSFSDEFETASEHFIRPSGKDVTTNDDVMLLYFTSGTVGFPKMVMHDYAYPLGHIITARYWQNVQDGGLHYTVADTGWAKSVWGLLYGQWISGSAVFVFDYDRFNAAHLLERATKHGVTTFCAPPTIWRFMIKEDLSQYNFSTLKYCVVAGEPLNPEVYERFKQATGLKLMEGYGQTELVVTAATWPWLEPKPGSMGKPSPSYNIVLLDREGKPCEVGEEGEIAIDTREKTPFGIFKGYYRDADKTRDAWHDGFYYTGDTAWMDEDGYLWFVGRSDDLIKSSGYRIGPFEVESALIQHPAVLECAITGVPDPDRGQVVKATIVLTKDYKPSEELIHELQEHVKKETAPYKYPRVIEFVEALPKTISGKIRRVEIRNTDSK